MAKQNKPLTNAETAAFCSQMSMILTSGISTLEGVSILLEDSSNEKEKALLNIMNDTLLSTGSFYLAVKDANVFPDYMLQMVQLGEQTGKLDEVMESLADYYEKEHSLSQSLRNAISYPFLMILMMIVVILVLITKVMPVFHQVFNQLGTEMTGASLALLNFGQFLNKHAFAFGIILLLLTIFLIYLFKAPKGQLCLRRILEKIPSFRNLQELMGARRFASGMALSLSSGLTPLECLRLSIPLVTNASFRGRLECCEKEVASGGDLCESLLSHKIFTGLYAKMASIGAKTGVMDEVMEKIAGQYEDEINEGLSKVVAAIEPSLVIILSLIVGVILLSVMLPLISIMAGL